MLTRNKIPEERRDVSSRLRREKKWVGRQKSERKPASCNWGTIGDSGEQETEVRGVTLISCLPVVLHSVVAPLTVPPTAPDRKPSLDVRTIESFFSLRWATLRRQTESRHCVVSKISQSPASSNSFFL